MAQGYSLRQQALLLVLHHQHRRHADHDTAARANRGNNLQASTAMATRTVAPSSLPRRTLAGTASSHPLSRPRHTLVLQVIPSTVAVTGTRPKGPAVSGACSAGTAANTHDDGPAIARVSL